jgi:hypothetical protein
MAHDLVTEVLRVGRDGGHRTIGNSVDVTEARKPRPTSEPGGASTVVSYFSPSHRH